MARYERYERIGNRRHAATFKQHDGSTVGHGQPDYKNPDAWEVFVSNWPCQLVATSGGEFVRGKQVTAETTHVLFGEYFGVTGVTAKMKVEIPDETGTQTYYVVESLDKEGDARERRIEVKRKL